MKLQSDLFVGVVPFVRAAEEQSFARAAASLGVSTAAISKAVRKLEDDLGVRLLERTSRVVTLTREGELFLERCQPAVRSVQGAREVILGTRREPQGEVSLTVPFLFAPIVVASLPAFSAQYPRLAFRLDVTDRVARLASESYDVAVRMGDLDDSSLVARLLKKTRWATVASPSYLARKGTPKTLEELASQNCLRFVAPNGRPRDWTFSDGQRTVRFAAKGNVLVDHGASLLGAAEAGMGVCQVLDFMVAQQLRSGALIELLAHASAEGPDVRAVTTPTRAGSANVRAVIKLLVAAFA